MNVAIVGCGLIGTKRAKYLSNLGARLTWCIDSNREMAEKLAYSYGGRTHDNLLDILIAHGDSIDVVFVATPHKYLAPFAQEALSFGKHVFIEKPGAIKSRDLLQIEKYALKKNLKVRIGYNHNYHPAFLKAFEKINTSEIGDVMYINALYGHGGAHLEKGSWRTDRDINGGGDLIDKGVHLIDLAQNVFLNTFTFGTGKIQKYYWNQNVEDNAFMLLETTGNKIAFLQTSCTEWKNTFRFSITGTAGKLEINGLGGSYGTETLTTTLLRSGEIKPSVVTEEFLDEDNSWELEMRDFFLGIHRNRLTNIKTAYETLKIVEVIYANR